MEYLERGGGILISWVESDAGLNQMHRGGRGGGGQVIVTKNSIECQEVALPGCLLIGEPSAWR